MKTLFIQTWMILSFFGVPAIAAEPKQPAEKPFYLSDGVIGAVVAFVLGSVGSYVWGGSKKVSEADKEKFKFDLLKEVGIVVDQKIAIREEIKELELKNILLKIQGSIDNLSTEIRNRNNGFESTKESIIRRFESVEKQVGSQQSSMNGFVERVNQAIHTSLAQYGVDIAPVKIRKRTDSIPFDYDTRDEGNIG